MVAAAGRRYGGAVPICGRSVPVRVDLVMVWARPKRLQRTDPAARLPKTTPPDLDNVIKSILDGITASNVLHDDRSIQKCSASKWFGRLGEPPHVEVLIYTGSQHETNRTS